MVKTALSAATRKSNAVDQPDHFDGVLQQPTSPLIEYPPSASVPRLHVQLPNQVLSSAGNLTNISHRQPSSASDSHRLPSTDSTFRAPPVALHNPFVFPTEAGSGSGKSSHLSASTNRSRLAGADNGPVAGGDHGSLPHKGWVFPTVEHFIPPIAQCLIFFPSEIETKYLMAQHDFVCRRVVLMLLLMFCLLCAGLLPTEHRLFGVLMFALLPLGLWLLMPYIFRKAQVVGKAQAGDEAAVQRQWQPLQLPRVTEVLLIITVMVLCTILTVSGFASQQAERLRLLPGILMFMGNALPGTRLISNLIGMVVNLVTTVVVNLVMGLLKSDMETELLVGLILQHMVVYMGWCLLACSCIYCLERHLRRNFMKVLCSRGLLLGSGHQALLIEVISRGGCFWVPK